MFFQWCRFYFMFNLNYTNIPGPKLSPFFFRWSDTALKIEKQKKLRTSFLWGTVTNATWIGGYRGEELNYAPHAPWRLICLCVFAPYVPYAPWCLTHVSYLPALGALFVSVKIFLGWICIPLSFFQGLLKTQQTVLFLSGSKNSHETF